MQTQTKKLSIDSAVGFERRTQRISDRRARQLFASAQTLGASDDVRVACDSALQDAGVFSLIAHSINLGQMPLISFMGYAALQQIQQHSLIRTLIQVPVRDMLKPGFELSIDRRMADKDIAEILELLDPDDEKQRQQEAIGVIEDKWDEHKLNKKLQQALELDGYEGGAFVFIDTGASGSDLKLPLNISQHSEELSPDRPLKFKVIDPINCFPGTYNSSEPLGDFYFEPQTWWVLGTQVHCSRLIRFASNSVPLLLKPAYNFLGIPQAQLYWDYVVHWNQNRESANRLLNKFSLVAFKTNMADLLSGGVADDLNRRIDYLATKRSNDGILLMDNETEDVISLNTPLGGVTDIVKQSLEALAVVSHIPAVVLFGQSPQGFNATGESDLTNYSNLIESRREGELKEPISKLVEILKIKYTDCIDPVTVKFVPFDTSKGMQDAQTELLKAQVAATHIQAGLTSAEEERQKLANDRQSGYNFIEPDELPDEGGSLPDDLMQGIPTNENAEGTNAERGDEPQAGAANERPTA